ncbi:hypothetical protein KUCAC02_028028 [Chaenocephalus aceratus]|uniref:Uncharacterized protein n=1 Tax=Chaenocephalus aceratus TaxID=36190 RepID=A0ACB9X0N6_CHAAC|nr:hypothetical protein KUCAC02_028028 [Chaenocephalus aceratus]
MKDLQRRAIKMNLSTILNVALLVTLLTSCVMFTPFFYLNFQTKILVLNVTEKAVCAIKKPLFPVWVNVNDTAGPCRGRRAAPPQQAPTCWSHVKDCII